MTAFISPDHLSDLVGLIYDAAIDPERWPIAMDAIRAELGFHNAGLTLQRLPAGDVIAIVACNLAPEYLALVGDAGADILEQWGGKAVVSALPMEEPAILSRVNPAFALLTKTNNYTAGFGQPHGIMDVLSIGLARDPRAMGTLSFGRHGNAGPIGEREIAVARLLIPHLQRAATINRMLDKAETAKASFEATLESLTVPILLVDAERRLIHANPAGRELLDRGDPLHVWNGSLGSTVSAVTSALGAAVDQAANDESQIGRKGLGIPVRRLDGSVGALHVLPFRKRRAALNQNADAVAAVFVSQIDTPFVAPTEMIAALFGLTPAEARVFDNLVSGNSVIETALALNVQRSTIKTHLLRLYAKIGVKRQADLLQVAASLSIPIAT